MKTVPKMLTREGNPLPKGPDTFEKIGREAVKAAEAVPCDFAVFVAGLEAILGEVEDRLEIARHELEQKEEE